MTSGKNQWPGLDLSQWQRTYETLHVWSQVVGKIRLAQMPWINHSWHTTLCVTTKGLGTSTIPYGDRSFSIDFDFSDHQLRIHASDGSSRSFKLEPMSVAAFYRKLMQELKVIGIMVSIWPIPVEIPGQVKPFPKDDEPGTYDSEYVTRFWQILLNVHRVFTKFRSRFIGKVSPVHFFWGAFDLAVTRFSGRTAPTHPGGAPNCADWIMEEAYSHELSSVGFWPGAGLGEPAFYSYAYPEPKGFREYPVQPEAAYYHPELGEYVLPYEAVRIADKPESMLLEFLQTTYEAAANLAAWERGELERRSPGEITRVNRYA